jgi:orotidine-5'-phosphate decarboxylase
MNFKKKIFCALDFSDLDKTLEFTDLIKEKIGGIKVGLEFFCKFGPSGVLKLKNFQLPIFLDLKLHDIPNTVRQSAKNLIDLSPDYLTIHLSGGFKMIEELNDIKKNTKLIGVTMLTSLNENDLINMGINCGVKKYIDKLVNLGINSGIDGIVTSANEVKDLKKKFNNLTFVTPGIRMPEQDSNDQKRIFTPGQAINNGSSMLVIGRPITCSRDPIRAIEEIILNITKEQNYGS